MITDDRIAAISALCRRAHTRMDPAYPWQLLHACDELAAEVTRLTPRQTRLALDADPTTPPRRLVPRRARGGDVGEQRMGLE